MVAMGLTRALERAGIPIYGVSIGRASDRATWLVNFKAEATSGQRADAAALLETYQLDTDAQFEAERVERTLAAKALGSLARVTWENLPTGKPTWLVFLDRWKAIYRNL